MFCNWQNICASFVLSQGQGCNIFLSNDNSPSWHSHSLQIFYQSLHTISVIQTWAQCYKKLLHNLRILIISQSVCPWQAFPAQSIVCLARPGVYPIVEHLKGSSIGQVLALETDIRPGWKGLPRTNTIAYYKNL